MFDMQKGTFGPLGRPDWIFFNRGSINVIDGSQSSVRLASTLLEGTDSPTYGPAGDINQPSYVGTIVLEVGALACGSFSINLLPPPTDTFMVSNSPGQLRIPGVRVFGITVHTVPIGSCVCTQIEAVDGAMLTEPPHCWVDSRQPSDPDGANPANVEVMDLKFNCPDSQQIADEPQLFDLIRDGSSIFRGISTVVANTPDAGWVRLTLRDPIHAGVWTCVNYARSNQNVCVASLPGDANQDLATEAAADLVRLIGCVKGQATCELNACDMDRSGLCAPGDVLRVIDLFNGGDTFAVWDGAFLADCPE